MIGIINDVLTAYIISEKIKEKYPKVDIFISNNIENLINKKCQIVITDQDLKINNKDIIILKLEEIKKDNAYYLESNELLEAINKGENKKVLEIINNLSISKEKIIIINNPKLLLIKHLIEEKYSNQIISNLDYIIDKLEKIIINNNINTNNLGIVKVIN